MKKTGRVFIHDDYNVKLVTTVPDHDEWHLWTEFRGDDGDLIYVSDHEDYTLVADEFGPIDTDGRIYSTRGADEVCEAGTPGCCINHEYDEGTCEGW